jgi:hypothetical protein
MGATSIAGVGAGALNLKLMMDKVLAKTVAVFEQYSVPLPTRRLWQMGEPFVEEEQLCVALMQVYLGMPGDEASRPLRGTSARSAVLSIQMSRATPMTVDGSAPAAADIQAYAAISAVDAYVFTELIPRLDQWDDDGVYGMGVIATLEAPVAEGSYETLKMQVTMVIP